MRCPNGHESVATDWCDTCGEAMPAGAGTASSMPSGAPANPLEGSGAPANPLEGSGEPPANPLDPSGAGATSETAGVRCPTCGTVSDPGAFFCEVCGHDFTTGADPTHDAAPSPQVADVAPAKEGVIAVTVDDTVAPSQGDGAGGNPSPDLQQSWVAEIWIDPAWYASQRSPDPLPSPGPPMLVPLRHRSLLVGRTSLSRGIHPDVDCGVDNGVSRRHAQLTTDGSRWWVEDLQSSNGTFVGDAVGSLPTEPLRPGTRREIDADDRIYLGSWTRIVLRPAEEGEV